MADGNSGGSTTVDMCLGKGIFNTGETYTIKIPNDVTAVRPGGHFGTHHMEAYMHMYINGVGYDFSSNRPEQIVSVTPGSVLNITNAVGDSAAPEGNWNINTWGIYAKTVIGSDSTGTTGSITAGNLVVNGTDTGSATGSGTVTGTVNVSAIEANKEQDYLFYDTVTFKVEETQYEATDYDENATESSYGYGDSYGIDLTSTNKIKLSFGYLQSSEVGDYQHYGIPVLACPIYVPDKNIRDIINDKIISVWFDDYPVVWSRPISYYSIYTNSIYAVWWPDFPLPGCSTENLEGLSNFMSSKCGKEVTMHIKVE